MLTYPEELLSAAEANLRREAMDFVMSVPRELIVDLDADRVRYPRQYVEEAGRRNLLGLRFPRKYGGRGLPWTSELIALEEVGTLGTALGCAYSMVSIVGEALNAFGTEQQKDRFLAPIIAGRMVSAEALTEPRGGSDFFGATSRAVRKGDHLILNGNKRFVVGAEGADFFLVYARTAQNGDPRHSMTALIVERGEGVAVEHVYGLMGTRGGGTGRLSFRDVKVPIGNVLGGEAGIGQGAEVFDRMMIPERLTPAASALGMGRVALEIAARYTTRRKAFGRPIRSFQGVSFMVAESVTRLDAARSLCRDAARAIDARIEQGRVRRMVSEAKKFSSESMWEVVNDAMQILGGIGYTNIFPVERLMRDARLNMIWTGTSQVMNLVIQHELFDEMRALEAGARTGRDAEQDAEGARFSEEKVFE
jgi:alkylation response protein AidB-like acyl-CoA dehydrogenase